MNGIHIQENKTMNSLSIVFSSSHFFLTTFSQQSPIPSIYHFFFSFSFYVTFNALMHRNFGLPRPHFPSLSGHLLSASFSSLIVFYMTSPCTHHQCPLRYFARSYLHFHFIHFLLSALLTATIILTSVILSLANLDLLLLFLY